MCSRSRILTAHANLKCGASKYYIQPHCPCLRVMRCKLGWCLRHSRWVSFSILDNNHKCADKSMLIYSTICHEDTVCCRTIIWTELTNSGSWTTSTPTLSSVNCMVEASTIILKL